MKLFTNPFDKNSRIEKTSADIIVSSGRNTKIYYIVNEANEKIRVYKSAEVYRNQLHYKDGTPIKDSGIIKTLFKRGDNYFVVVKNEEIEVFTKYTLRRRLARKKKGKKSIKQRISKNDKNSKVVNSNPIAKITGYTRSLFPASIPNENSVAATGDAGSEVLDIDSSLIGYFQGTFDSVDTLSLQGAEDTNLELLDIDPLLTIHFQGTFDTVDTTSIADTAPAREQQRFESISNPKKRSNPG